MPSLKLGDSSSDTELQNDVGFFSNGTAMASLNADGKVPEDKD